MATRRRALVAIGAAPVTLAACSQEAKLMFKDVPSAIAAVQALAPKGRSTGAWTLAQVLNHAAQSVEFSLQGFPAPKSRLFQATLGAAAFAVFQARGRMSHSLSEPIPGAPALAAGDPLQPAIDRLVAALQAFQAHSGPLQPHFAYGHLDKAQYTQAHLMHLANHWDEITNQEG